MKKPEKNKQKKLSAIKRGVKRSQRLKDSRAIVAKKRESLIVAKMAKEKKMNEMMDQILQSQFKQG
jgi:hypothetical protein